MFRENTEHLQADMFSFYESLPQTMRDRLISSKEYAIYRLFFCYIKEEDYSCLYSDKKSRPNAPVNAMLTALLLMNQKGWTFEELFDSISFNMLTKVALGLKQLDEKPFCESTLFLFMKQLGKYYSETGINLVEKTFNSLTEEQRKQLKIKTNIQRTDSLLLGSKIKNYTRLELLVEMLIRLYKILAEKDKEKYKEQFERYVERTAENFVFKVKHSEAYEELEQLAIVYDILYKKLMIDYSDNPVFKVFERVYKEQFKTEKGEIRVKPGKEVQSNSLQSPDDQEATYHKKRYGKESKGQKINVVETASPKNQIQLITDISVHANNVDDSIVLNERIEKIKQKTPQLNELHLDGGYGSTDNDEKLMKHKILPIQTAVKGIHRGVEINIEEIEKDKKYRVSCPKQTVESSSTTVRHKVIFNNDICSNCEHIKTCPVRSFNKKNIVRVFYFKHKDYLRNKRINNVNRIPEQRRKLRANVEATICEFARGRINGKLKVRGYFKTTVYAFLRGISINFGRIYRYIREKITKGGRTMLFLSQYIRKRKRNYFISITKRYSDLESEVLCRLLSL